MLAPIYVHTIELYVGYLMLGGEVIGGSGTSREDEGYETMDMYPYLISYVFRRPLHGF